MKKTTSKQRQTVVEQEKARMEELRAEILTDLWRVGDMAEEALSPSCGDHTEGDFARDVGTNAATISVACRMRWYFPDEATLRRVLDAGLTCRSFKQVFGRGAGPAIRGFVFLTLNAVMDGRLMRPAAASTG